jgi:hypothetical protein
MLSKGFPDLFVALTLQRADEPLGDRAEKAKLTRDNDEEVRRILDISDGHDELVRSIRRFNPEPSDMKFLLDVMRAELPAIKTLLSEPEWEEIEYDPRAFEEEDLGGTGIFDMPCPLYVSGAYAYRLRDKYRNSLSEEAIAAKNDPIGYQDFLMGDHHIAPWVYEQALIDANVIQAYREYYTPWLAPYLYHLAARPILRGRTPALPVDIMFELFQAGDRLPVRTKHKPIRRLEGKYFDHMAWYSAIDFRPIERKKPRTQVKERMLRLWPMRDLAAPRFDPSPNVARLAEEMQEGAMDVVKSIVTLGDYELYEVNRKEVDRCYRTILEWRSSENRERVRKGLAAAAVYSVNVDRIVGRLIRKFRGCNPELAREDEYLPKTLKIYAREQCLEAIEEYDPTRNPSFTASLNRRLWNQFMTKTRALKKKRRAEVGEPQQWGHGLGDYVDSQERLLTLEDLLGRPRGIKLSRTQQPYPKCTGKPRGVWASRGSI